MKTITKGKMWCFAIGQFGWSLLSALITNWLVYFYQPDADSIAAGQTLFIPQGRVILGIATVIGGIAALGRVFDAVTDPMIANLSDRSTNPKGRRIPFMQKIAIPFALITVLVFWAPVNAISTVNCIWLLVTLLLFYLFMTTYCTPYNALISELGTTQDTRISISTYISVTFLLGSAIGYAAPFIWGALEPSMGRVTAIRITFAILAVIGLIALLVPTFTINEKEYVHTVPSNDDAFTSLIKTFKNPDFRIFVGSDVLYFLGLTIFQTGLPFFITSLMKLPETFTTILYVAMTLLSFASPHEQEETGPDRFCRPGDRVSDHRSIRPHGRLRSGVRYYNCLRGGLPYGDPGNPSPGDRRGYRGSGRSSYGREPRGYVLRGENVCLQIRPKYCDAGVHCFRQYRDRNGTRLSNRSCFCGSDLSRGSADPVPIQ